MLKMIAYDNVMKNSKCTSVAAAGAPEIIRVAHTIVEMKETSQIESYQISPGKSAYIKFSMAILLAVLSSIVCSSTPSAHRSLRQSVELIPYRQSPPQSAIITGTSRRPRRLQGKKLLAGCTTETSFNRLINVYGWEETTASDIWVLDSPPAVILFCQASDISSYPVNELYSQETKVAFWCEDIETCVTDDDASTFFSQFDIILSPDAPLWQETFGHVMPLTTSVEWIPNAAELAVLEEEFQTQSIMKILLNGKKLNGLSSAIAREMAPETLSFSPIPSFTVEALNSHVATVVVDTKSITSELFNIQAAGSLLVVPQELVPMLEALGMEDTVHFISIDYNSENDLKTQIDWILDPKNLDSVVAIRRAGYDLVRAQHTIMNRTSRINHYFEAI